MTNETKPKRSLGCCLLKIFLALFLLGVIVAGILGFTVYRAARWFNDAAQPIAATYEPLKISEGERQDIDRIIQEVQLGKKNHELIDEYITPNVFNGILDTIIQGEIKRGKTPNPEVFRGGFDGQHLSIAFTATTQKHGTAYISGKATFDLEIEDGEIKQAHVHKLNVGGREAPWTVMAFANNILVNKLKHPDDAESRRSARNFKAFKLLKREGDRLHVILDPKQFKDNQEDVPVPPSSEKKSADKTEF